jgi:hypothetical protein
MQGRSKSGDLLQSVLFVLELHFEFDKCIEGPPCVLWSFRVPENLPRFRLRRSRFEAFLVDTLPCVKPFFGQLRRTAFEEAQNTAVCAMIGNS